MLEFQNCQYFSRFHLCCQSHFLFPTLLCLTYQTYNPDARSLQRQHWHISVIPLQSTRRPRSFPFHTCPCSKKLWSSEWTLPILSIRRSAHLAGDTAFMTLHRSFYVHRKNKKGSDNKGIPLWLGAFMIPHGYSAGISCGNCGICVLNVGGRGLMVTYISHVYLSESVK